MIGFQDGINISVGQFLDDGLGTVFIKIQM